MRQIVHRFRPLPHGAAILLGLLLGAAAARSADLTVFAAASLTDALKTAGTRYHQQAGVKVSFNFAASSMLARQIEEGAPADIFFSADEAWMNRLARKNLILKGTRKDRLSNSLVIVIPSDSTLVIRSPAGLARKNVRRIALADPEVVPAGIYAREYLEQARLWTAVNPKVVRTENVRAALAAVESGNVEAGMVYKTDAATSKEVKIACAIPRAQGPDIRYPMAVLKDSNHIEAARKFLHYLDSDKAAEVFENYGFIVLK